MGIQGNNKKGKKGNLIKKLKDFLTSLKLTIFLMIILALTSIVGTIIPQNALPDQYLRYYSLTTYQTLKALGFLDVYHSWWFILLLSFLCLNLLVCSLKSFPRIWKIITQPNPILNEEQIKALPYLITIKKDFSLDEIKERIIEILKKHFGPPRETFLNGTFHLFAEKSRFSRLGVFITHASVIIILAGGLIGSIFGFEGNVNIVEGQSIDRILIPGSHLVKELGFEVRCDEFEVTYYPNGIPKEYQSTLTILEDGKKVLTKTIEVNHPLKYKGYVFYQSSYGTAPDQGGELILEVKKRGSKDPGRQFKVEVGDSFLLPEAGLLVKVNRFFTDFIMDEKGRAANRSLALKNPAAELLILKDGKIHNRIWVFQRYPHFHGSKELDYQFFIQGFKGKEYTGLQVTKDPGVWLVWTGCILMIIGILFTFFFSHRRIWSSLPPIEEKSNW